MLYGTGGRARLDLAMPSEIITTAPASSVPADDADFVTDAKIRELEKANMLAALRHASWRIWGTDGAAELLVLKPSTLTYRMKVFNIRKAD